MPSPPYMSMMLEPPGAITTEPPLRLPSGGRKTVRNGRSSGPLPFAKGTLPGSQSGILQLTAASSPAGFLSTPGFLSAASNEPEIARAARIPRHRRVEKKAASMQSHYHGAAGARGQGRSYPRV